jgi:hypothetical protein
MRVCSSCPAIVGVAGPRRSFWPRLSGGAFLPPLTCIRRGNLDHHLTLLARRATVAGAGTGFPEGPAAARSAVTDLEPQRPRSRSCLSRGLFVRLTQELLPKIVRDVSAVGQTTGKRSARLPRSTATDAACDPSGPRAKSLQGLHRPAWRPLFLSKQQRHAPTQSSRVDGGSGLIFRLLDREPRGDQPP